MPELVDINNPLKTFTDAWVKCIQLARKHKEEFNLQAREAMGFFDGNQETMWNAEAINGWYRGGDLPQPDCRVSINKTYEAVSIFGPSLYYQNPHRQVNPRKAVELPREAFGPQGDMMADFQWQMWMQEAQAMSAPNIARSALLETYLNYTPNELGLVSHMRKAVDEAIIKGLATCWTEVYQRPGSQQKFVGSFYDTVDNLLIDPDMRSLEEANWISRSCTHPIWWVEDEYRIPRGTLKGNLESTPAHARAMNKSDERHRRMMGQTCDLLEYHKVYSRMGMGDLIQEMPQEVRGMFDQFGPNIYLVVAEGIDYPLNLPPEMQQRADFEEIFAAVQWPTPFWADAKWPCTALRWNNTPGKLYPFGLITPAIGELRAINWIASHLMGKVRTTCRDFLVTLSKVSKQIDETLKEGHDFSHIKINDAMGDDIHKLVQFLQHPEMNGDILTCLNIFTKFFEDRTGLTPLLYGQNVGGVQSRSAADAQNKMQAANIRPDDMARQVEQMATDLARQEAIAARWHLTGQDVLPIFGRQGAALWDGVVATADLDLIINETEYRIESGSARKPNKDRDIENISQALQVLGGIFQGYAATTGDYAPLNEIISRWGSANDMDVSKLVLAPPPPMPMPMGPEAAPAVDASGAAPPPDQFPVAA